MRTFKNYLLIFILLLGFIGFTGCKNFKNPMGPDLPKPDDPKPPETPYPAEIVGTFQVGGGPVTLKGNRWEITLKSLQVVDKIYDTVCGFWWDCDPGCKLFIWRFEIKWLCHYGYPSEEIELMVTPRNYIQSSNGKHYSWSLYDNLIARMSGHGDEHFFPNEIVNYGCYRLPGVPGIHYNEKVALVNFTEAPENILNTQLDLIWDDTEWLVKSRGEKPQKFIFHLIF